MRRILTVLTMALVMAAIMLVMAMPALAAANADRAAQQGVIVSNFAPGELGPAAKNACNPNEAGGEQGCGDDVSARDSNPQN